MVSLRIPYSSLYNQYSVFDSSIRSDTCLLAQLWFPSWLRPRCLAPLGSSIRLLRHSPLILKDWNNSYMANSIVHCPADATVAFFQAANKKKVAVMI